MFLSRKTNKEVFYFKWSFNLKILRFENKRSFRDYLFPLLNWKSFVRYSFSLLTSDVSPLTIFTINHSRSSLTAFLPRSTSFFPFLPELLSFFRCHFDPFIPPGA